MAHPDGGGEAQFAPRVTFEQAYQQVQALEQENRQAVSRTTRDAPVLVRTGNARNGVPTLTFVGHGNVCFACWGYRLNCSGTRIGHCVEPFAVRATDL